MLHFLRPIKTAQKKAPWLWVGFLAGPWASMLYFEQISNVAVTFKLREFVSTPFIITAVGSFNLLFNILVGAGCNYASDRIWTPMGRRKPFLIVGWLVVAIGCIVLPELETLWLIVVVLFFYEMMRDVAIPYESLCNEVVPPHQRGRSTAAFTFARQAMMAFFFAVMIGQWDESFDFPGGFVVSGQQLIFWTGAALALGCVTFISAGIRETPPAQKPILRAPLKIASARNVLRNFVRDVFGQRSWLALYAVGFSQVIFWMDFGSLTPLLFTEHWGFSKQDYGNIIALGSAFTLFVCLPAGGWLADHVDRLFLFKLTAATITAIHLLFTVYLEFRSGEGPPPLGAVLAYRLLHTGVGNIGVVCTVSLMFDFVPRDRLGTVSSGIGITRGITTLVFNNGIGIWVTAVTAFVGTRVAGQPTVYNYESGFVYLVIGGLLATGVAFWFARQVNTGRMVKLGVIEAQSE